MKPYLIQRASFEYLSLSEKSTEDQIKQRYREMSLKAHPDNGGSQEDLDKLSRGEFHLKECSYFDSYVKQDGYFKNHFQFWWDINNDVMFWKQDESFETKFRVRITE